MGDFFLGEIRAFPYPSNHIPSGWTPCDGRLMQIQQNQALFALLNTTYGGNGTTTFALPDLRGRVVMGSGINKTSGTNYKQGVVGGAETVTLTTTQIPPHTHTLVGNSETGNKPGIANNSFATCGVSPAITTPQNLFAPPGSNALPLNPESISSTGGGAGHSNIQPTQVVTYCIATTGIFPMRP